MSRSESPPEDIVDMSGTGPSEEETVRPRAQKETAHNEQDEQSDEKEKEEEDDEDEDEDEEDEEDEERGEHEEGEETRQTGFSSKKQREEYEKLLSKSYRDINTKMMHQRAEVARPGGLDIVRANLLNIDRLFLQSRRMAYSSKVVQTYDAKSLSNVSDLAEISVRNMKIGKSARHINIDDFLRTTKKYLLGGSNADIAQPDSGSNSDGDARAVATAPNGIITDEVLQEIEQRARERREQLDAHQDLRDLNLLRAGALYVAVGRTAPTIDFLKGPLTIEKKIRTFKRRARDDLPSSASGAAATADRPDLDALAKDKQDDTAVAVRTVFRCLRERQRGAPVDVFRFILNPHSFGQSVENMFYTSFLVHDGKVLLLRNSKTESWDIREVPGTLRAAAAINENQYDHRIFTLDFPKWQRLVRALGIKELFIPHREYN